MAMWSVHDNHVISAWSVTWLVHDLSLDQCMISHEISSCAVMLSMHETQRDQCMISHVIMACAVMWSVHDRQTNINTRYLILNISQFTWIWNLFRLIFLVFRIVWFSSAYFFRPIKLEFTYNFNNIIRKKQKTYAETYINTDRQRSYSLPFEI